MTRIPRCLSRCLPALLAGALVLGAASSALASGPHPSSEQILKLRIIQILGFAIVFAIFAIYVFPFAQRLLKERSAGIAGTFDEVEAGRRAATLGEQAAREGLAALDRTTDEVLEAAGKEGVRLRQSLVAEAEHAVTRIRKKGRVEVEVEQAKTLLQCQNLYAHEAFAVTEQSLRGAIDQKKHNAIVARFFHDLDQVGG